MKKHAFTTAVLIMAVLAAIALTIVGAVTYQQPGGPSTLLAGVVTLILTIAAFATARQVTDALHHNYDQWDKLGANLSERLEQFSVMINMISEQQLISERAKMVAFREKDHDTLLRAIRDEMNVGQYDAALLLVGDLETTFGYRQEAEQLRTEIAQLRDAGVRKAVGEVVTQIEHDCSAEKWDEALELARKISATYPGHETTATLVQQVTHRREAIKQQLMQRWHDAVARKDIDASIDVLRALDIYVTPEEVAQLKDGALEIFKARIERLREQFKECVHEKKWFEARMLGEDIVQEFPTSKLAQEVREMMPTIRSREADLSAANI